MPRELISASMPPAFLLLSLLTLPESATIIAAAKSMNGSAKHMNLNTHTKRHLTDVGGLFQAGFYESAVLERQRQWNRCGELQSIKRATRDATPLSQNPPTDGSSLVAPEQEFHNPRATKIRFGWSEGGHHGQGLPVLAAALGGKMKVGLRAQGNREVSPDNKSIHHGKRCMFGRYPYSRHSPGFQDFLTEISECSDCLIIEAVRQVPKQDAVEALRRVVHVFPDFADRVFLFQGFREMEVHVADIKPLCPPCEKNEIFLGGWPYIQHLSLGSGLEAFGE